MTKKNLKEKTVSARITKELYQKIKEHKIKVSDVINDALSESVGPTKTSMTREQYLALVKKGGR
jgi:hypothetical protein